MKDSFTIKQDFGFWDLYPASLFTFLGSKRGILFVLAALLGITVTKYAHNKSIDSIILPTLILLLTIIVFYAVVIFFVLKTNSSDYKNLTYEFTDWGIKRINSKYKFSRSWNKIRKFTETKSMFMLFVSPWKSIMVHKKVFTNEDEMNDFRDMLAEKIKT